MPLLERFTKILERSYVSPTSQSREYGGYEQRYDGFKQQPETPDIIIVSSETGPEGQSLLEDKGRLIDVFG